MKLSRDAAERLAEKFRTGQGLSLSEPINLKSLLRKLAILTVYKPLSDKFYGMSLKSQSGMRFILINSENAKGRQHFSIAHELYHLFFDEDPKPHVCGNCDSKIVSEQNADKFASALLLPYQGLIHFIPNDELTSKKISLATVIKTEQYFSVSRLALLVRLKDCSLISNTVFEELNMIPVKESAKQYGYDTALYNKGNEGLVIGDFGEKARLLYEKEIISEGHYLELLNKISSNEL